MNKIRSQNIFEDVNNLFGLISALIFTICVWLVINLQLNNKSYSVFIEFDNAHGIQEGTPLRIRGVKIGSVKDLKIEFNSILALVQVNSLQTVIPKNSIIETNQTGLLSEAIIDIIPMETIIPEEILLINPLSEECNTSSIVCNGSILEGDRGLNYDDLVRASTRISQRFDDPRMFNLLYLFLQNGIELSESILSTTFNLSDIITIISSHLQKTMTKIDS